MRFAWIAEPPFNYRDGGSVTGCDVELARHVAKMLGDVFDPSETDFAELLNGLQDGRWDVTTGMFITPERASRAAFTRPIWALRDGLLVRNEHGARIAGYRSLASSNATLAVLEGQVQHQTALRLGVDPGNILVFKDYTDAVSAVRDGRATAYASVERAHMQHIATRPDESLACVAVPLTEKAAEPGAFACRDETLRGRFDAVLTRFLGTPAHATLLRSFGFSDDEIGTRAR
jgi:polar amino acid transport system substrate-binding protein